MKINWKVRLKNPVFWFNLAAAIFLPMLAFGSSQYIGNTYTNG